MSDLQEDLSISLDLYNKMQESVLVLKNIKETLRISILTLEKSNFPKHILNILKDELELIDVEIERIKQYLRGAYVLK